jgi:hypothetical protein
LGLEAEVPLAAHQGTFPSTRAGEGCCFSIEAAVSMPFTDSLETAGWSWKQKRAAPGDDARGSLVGPLFGGRGWDFPQGTDELDNGLVAPGRELLHGAGEVLCLLA